MTGEPLTWRDWLPWYWAPWKLTRPVWGPPIWLGGDEWDRRTLVLRSAA